MSKKSITQNRRGQTHMRSFSDTLSHVATFTPKETPIEGQAVALRQSLKKVSDRLNKAEKQLNAAGLCPLERAELERRVVRMRQVWADKVYRLEHLNDEHVRRSRSHGRVWSKKKSTV